MVTILKPECKNILQLKFGLRVKLQLGKERKKYKVKGDLKAYKLVIYDDLGWFTLSASVSIAITKLLCTSVRFLESSKSRESLNILVERSSN